MVNPHQYGIEGKESAEGQAFVLIMQAAWKDWKDEGSPGGNSALGVQASGVGMLVVAFVGMLLV